MLSFAADNWFWVVLACAGLLVFAWFYYRRTAPPLHFGLKNILRLLRFVAIIALLLSLADSLLSYQTEHLRRGTVAVLIDRSASMEQTDEEDGSTRWQRVNRWIDDNLQHAQPGKPDFTYLTFGDSLDDVQIDPGDYGYAASTSLGDAIVQFEQTLTDENLLGVLVLSDGAANRGFEPVDAARRFSAKTGVPIWTVGFGEAIGMAAARIVNVGVPAVAYTDKPFEVSARIATGLSEDATLRLRRGRRVLDRQSIPGSPDGGFSDMTFETTIDQTGRVPLALDIVDAEGRPDTLSARSFFVRVLPSKLRVLLHAYKTDWEFTYLRRYLEESDLVELTVQLDGPEGRRLTGNVSSDLGQYDVAIFLSPSRDQLREDWSPSAESFLTVGHAAVFMLGEEYSRAAQGNQIGAFPLDFVRQALPLVRGEYNGVVSGVHRNHPLVRLGHDESDITAVWRELPPFNQVLRIFEVPSDALVMVSASTLPEQVSGRMNADPIIVAREHDRGGKALLMCASSFWKWAAQRAGEGLPATEYESFWTSALRWLTLADDTDRQGILVDREVYHAGEPIQLTANLFDEAYNFISGARVQANIWQKSEEGEREQTFDTLTVFLPLGEGERYSTTVRGLAPGLYEVSGNSQVGEQSIAMRGTVFRVEPFGLEAHYSAANPALLQRVAEESAGRYYSEHQQPAILDSLDMTPRVDRKTHEIPIWPKTWVLIVFVTVLSAEWWIRRRKQLL